MRNIILLFSIYFSLLALQCQGRNKGGNIWVMGLYRAATTTFTDTSKPLIFPRFQTPPLYFWQGHSNICDSATGKLLFACNGMVLYDSNCVVMDNGDSLVPLKAYTHNAYPNGMHTQNSIIIPKGSAGLYYVVVTTVSDSTYNATWVAGAPKSPFDLLLYNVVDINANGGLGKVIEKNKILLKDYELHKTMMQACRHSNGLDWWLLKQGRYGENEVIRFLFTKDSVYGPYTQSFADPVYTPADLFGQYAFSSDGKKFAAVQCYAHKLFLADFDRCTGELSNTKIFNVPLDSTTQPNALHIGDSILNGVCFSPNDKYVYITRRYNIYQFEHDEPDSALAWFRVIHGPDTTYQKFQEYSSLHLGPDGRIYIGNVAGQYKQMSVIDKPDIKGLGCQFCRKCFRLGDNTLMAFGAPPSIPDFNLGPSGVQCWPVGNQSDLSGGQTGNERESGELIVYPNPSNTIFQIKNATGKKKELFSITGALLFTTHKDEIEVGKFSKGIYYLRCEGQRVKVVVE